MKKICRWIVDYTNRSPMFKGALQGAFLAHGVCLLLYSEIWLLSLLPWPK
jgi:hypothetical protein